MTSYEDLAKRLGVNLDTETLRLALTHRSYAYEHGGCPHNERLEFLGDSVLGLSITNLLYRSFPDRSEGELAKLRAAVVSSKALARVARAIDLGEHILLGEGEIKTAGRDKTSILADTMEAIFGAVYLSLGFVEAEALVLRLVAPLLDDKDAIGAGMDWKTVIQEHAAQAGMGAVVYVVEGEGPDHQRTFTAEVLIGGTAYGTGTGRSKKEAERAAAEHAWERLDPERRA
ncbi:ribonuclease III [Falsarthrobacter nasiphocae]|uniref:Ribonuclease 3 n=1 Tax=Falsarthrobacter nasiphocae TaxID=189863 RepID=A0AAE3YIJ7_9MICC|nr:ribonuclease III [Falsarthrobacter nasiphocae]MDR6892850.1 ribonuclease-3 [Falsarthrobacter nasiphocae]